MIQKRLTSHAYFKIHIGENAQVLYYILICLSISRRNLAISLGVRSLCSSQVCTVPMKPAAKKLIRYLYHKKSVSDKED